MYGAALVYPELRRVRPNSARPITRLALFHLRGVSANLPTRSETQ